MIRTFGSECLNVKENAHDNLFEGNACSDNAESVDFDGSNVELRGHDNVVRGNVISDSAGYGVKIQSDEEQYDLGGNTVENNRITGTAAEPLKIKTFLAAGPDLRERGRRRRRGGRDRGLHRRPHRSLPDRRHGSRPQLTRGAEPLGAVRPQPADFVRDLVEHQAGTDAEQPHVLGDRGALLGGPQLLAHAGRAQVEPEQPGREGDQPGAGHRGRHHRDEQGGAERDLPAGQQLEERPGLDRARNG